MTKAIGGNPSQQPEFKLPLPKGPRPVLAQKSALPASEPPLRSLPSLPGLMYPGPPLPPKKHPKLISPTDPHGPQLPPPLPSQLPVEALNELASMPDEDPTKV